MSMGYAYPLAGAGVNVTILYGRVTDAADEYRVSAGTLLAYAMAHEIGHVLLRSADHRGHGLMSGPWGATEFSHVRKTSLFFDRTDGARMKASIAREGCEVVVSSR